jgi:peptidoglycan LD-endopeptidase CwlK
MGLAERHAVDLNSRDLALLTPAFRASVEKLVVACRTRGVKIVPYCTLIGPKREAALYAHTRTWAQIQIIKSTLEKAGAPKLAALFTEDMSKGRPQSEWKSNALPGQSYHSWGEAADCYVETSGKADWLNVAGYEIYAQEAEKLGLTAGHRWRFKDSVHVQARPVGTGKPTMPEALRERALAEIFSL